MEGFGSTIRKRILFIVIAGFFSLLVFQLFNMQILQAEVFDQKSKDNSIKGFSSEAPRGIYYDRNLNVIVSNKPAFTLQITPAFYDTSANNLIENTIGEKRGYINQILYANRRFSKYSPRSIKRDIDFQTVAWIDENSEILKGVSYKVELQRDYSYGISGSHIFGYIKELSPEQYRKNKDVYDLGDLVGNSGVEKKYEKYLRGEKGVNYFVVDSRQKVVGKYNNGINDQLPVKGNDLVLTIDGPTQKIAEELMKGKKGAAVALDPKTGEIIALVSAPDYDLSSFASVTSQEIMSQLINDPDKPLFNRATSSIYSPGSTHKMVGAIAGLEEGIITENSIFECEGGIYYGDRFFKCLHVDGKVKLDHALEHSCNTYFYKLVLQLDIDKWAKYCKLFGFGSKLNLDIGEETEGILPDRDYYDRIYGKDRWPHGLVVNLGIGQGELGVTPLQLANYIALIANDGVSHSPHFVKGYMGDDKKFVEFDFPKKNIGISEKSFQIVKNALYKVVNGEGTASIIRMKNLKIAGKTGTAQNPFGKEHALFVGFAPFDDPQIAVAVIVENAGYGGTHAAPIARDMMKTYLNVEDPPPPRYIKKVEPDTLVTGDTSDSAHHSEVQN